MATESHLNEQPYKVRRHALARPSPGATGVKEEGSGTELAIGARLDMSYRAFNALSTFLNSSLVKMNPENSICPSPGQHAVVSIWLLIPSGPDLVRLESRTANSAVNSSESIRGLGSRFLFLGAQG